MINDSLDHGRMERRNNEKGKETSVIKSGKILFGVL